MAKEAGPKRAGEQGDKTTPISEAQADSRPAGKGSESRGVYVNERGEVCYGDNCVTLSVDAERNEIRVNIKQSADCDVSSLIEGLRDAIGTGSRTVYEVESEVRDKS